MTGTGVGGPGQLGQLLTSRNCPNYGSGEEASGAQRDKIYVQYIKH